MKLPRITIITPSYNQGEFIEEAILSVLYQYYPDLEYLVVDGGSTDETHAVLHRHAGRLRWINERYCGRAHAMNKGMQLATGDVVAFLNADELYTPGALHAVGRWFAQHPQALWVTGLCPLMSPVGHEVCRKLTRYRQSWLRLRSYQALCVFNYISQPATCLSHTALTALGPLDETLSYAFAYDYWLRLARHQRVSLLPAVLAYGRVQPASEDGNEPEARLAEELEALRRYSISPALRTLHHAHAAMMQAVEGRLKRPREARFIKPPVANAQ